MIIILVVLIVILTIPGILLMKSKDVKGHGLFETGWMLIVFAIVIFLFLIIGEIFSIKIK